MAPLAAEPRAGPCPRVLLVGLPAKAEAAPLKLTKDQKELVFTVKAATDTPPGTTKGLLCQVQVPLNGGSIAMPAVFPRIDGIEAEIRHAGAAIGAHSDLVLGRFGLTPQEIGALRQSRAVWT